MITHEEYQSALTIVLDYKKQCIDTIKSISDLMTQPVIENDMLIDTMYTNNIISLRLRNVILDASDRENIKIFPSDCKISDVIKYHKASERNMLRLQNMGKQTYFEFEKLLTKLT